MANEAETRVEAIRRAARVAAALRQRFVKTRQQTDILNKLLLLHEERNALAAMGTLDRIDGMALVAPTGSGKTRTLQWVFSELERLSDAPPAGAAGVRIASVRVRTPATLKTAAEAVMQEIGYPLPPRGLTETNAPGLWEKVHFQLRAQRITVLHFDEAQNIWGNANKPQRVAVINTLKSLTQNRQWPVIVVLSGTETLKEMLNQDQQLGRRIKPTEIRAIAKATDARTIRSVISAYLREADLEGFDEPDCRFIDRFFVACCNRLGIAIDLIIGAIQQAVLRGNVRLGDAHFALAFTHISECDAAMNPFISEDWPKIDASVMFARKEDADRDSASCRSPRLRRSD